MSALGLASLWSGAHRTGTHGLVVHPYGRRYSAIGPLFFAWHGVLPYTRSVTLRCDNSVDLNLFLFSNVDYSGEFRQFVLGGDDLAPRVVFENDQPAMSGLVMASNWDPGRITADRYYTSGNFPTSVRAVIEPWWIPHVDRALRGYGHRETPLEVRWLMFPEHVETEHGVLSRNLAYVRLHQEARIHGHTVRVDVYLRFGLHHGKATVTVVDYGKWVSGDSSVQSWIEDGLISKLDQLKVDLQKYLDGLLANINRGLTFQYHYLLPGNQEPSPQRVTRSATGRTDDVTFVYCHMT